MNQIKPTPSWKKCLKHAAIPFMLIFVLFFSACQKNTERGEHGDGKGGTFTSKDDATVATDWYKLQLRMLLQSNPAKSNIAANRLFAYSGISLYESSRFENHDLKSMQNQLTDMPAMPSPDNGKKYSWIEAANAALASITRNLFPTPTPANSFSIDSLEKLYADKITASQGADVVSRSHDFGVSVASAIFDWTKTDLFNHVNDPYTPPVFPGAWVPTPPAFAAAAAPYTGNCRTFMHIFSEGTTPPPPFPYSEDPSSDFYKMVNNDYLISQTLTTDQKNIALFWNDVGVGKGYTPMGHCLSILTQVLDNSNASLATADEAYAKAGIALWDATVVCWRSKFKYNQIRPVSYIQQHIDATWLSFIGTPAHPEYPAAHAFITSSIMEVLTSIFGNKYHFTDHTYDFLGYPSRSYSSFEDAALECGESRVYGGIHYQPSVDAGHKYGSLVGEAAAAIDITK
ncbi:MAG: vanadium-dependent haloperoxidase [Bacteroidetes bacterium]|nr:vanadium-dependent haloperoxidase [Bacteroidota bacterium]